MCYSQPGVESNSDHSIEFTNSDKTDIDELPNSRDSDSSSDSQ